MKNNHIKIQQSGITLVTLTHCSQELSLVSNGDFMRTLSGQMVFTGPGGYQKYQTTIKGQGRHAPAFESLTRGMEVDVLCLQYLAQHVPQGVQTLALTRTAVQGSIRVLDTLSRPLPYDISPEGHVSLPKPEGGALYYQPLLRMMLTHVHMVADPVNGNVSWTLILEEV